MMRAFLPLALLAATACYSPRAVETRPGPYDGPEDAWGVAPLQASVWYDEHTGLANFDLSRPAHVAIFALRPGGGLEMIYPAIGYGSRMAFTRGRHFVRTGGSPYRLTGNWSMAYGQGPMYILLVASEDPLDLGAFRAGGMMNWLTRSAVTYNPYLATEALVGEIVANPAGPGWTTAMHVVWPTPVAPYRDRASRYMRVQCANGLVVVVPIAAWVNGYAVCPEHLPPPDSADADSIPGIREVAPKRPQPPEGWITTSVGELDLRQELRRVRAAHGKNDPGRLDLTPFRRPETGRLTRTGSRSAPGSYGDGRVSARPSTRPVADRPRPATRPETRSRPASRPEARSRPATPRPQARPAPRPSPPPKPKPTKPGGGGGDPS
jgi:hypothetical protein